MIVADNETAVDLLYYEAVAKTVVRIVTEKSTEPLSVGVHGDWGAGKSSVLMMVEEAFRKDERVLCIRFNGWLFQGFDDTKTALIETIVDELVGSRSGCQKVVDQAKKVWRRIDWMKLTRKAGSYGITLATGIPTLETLVDLRAAAMSALSHGDENTPLDKLKMVAVTADTLLKETEIERAPQQMHAFRKEFQDLLKAANIDRLVVLIDDLDRCLPETAIGTLEAIRLFLFVPHAAFVIAADEGMIEYCVRRHFPDLPMAAGPATYARNYLEKLIQVPFRLPALGYAETRVYVTMLLILNECGEDSEEYQNLVPLARSALQQPWTSLGLERPTIQEKFKSVSDPVERALNIAYRISPILTDGSRGNPRQIKRFINTMSLRMAIAEERGFAEELKIGVLAKVMLAERFAPEVFDSLARGSNNTGFSKELAALEAGVSSKAAKPEKPTAGKKTKGIAKETKVDQLPDWPNIEWAKKWAAILPALAEVDLRPYLFVSRDRRGGYGSKAELGELDELLEKLMGPPLQIKQIEPEIKRLNNDEAEQLFDALRSKVVDAKNLMEKPDGINGLATVCRLHPFLQQPLVGLLRDLSTKDLGAWVVAGWASAFTNEDAAATYEELKKDWAEQDENKMLKTAAKATAKLKSTKLGDR